MSPASAIGHTHTLFRGSWKIVEISHFPSVMTQEAIMEGPGKPGAGWAGGGWECGWAGSSRDHISHPSRTLTDLGLFKDSGCRG